MTAYVVETNVAIVANGRGDIHADVECQLACREKLREICSLHSQQVVVVDDTGLVFDEYRKHLNWKGEPGLGDMFFKYVFDHQYAEARVRQVSITSIRRRGREDFKELPKNTVDEDDRKFLATAVVAKATILNAADSDWDEKQAQIKSLDVTVEELCPHMLKTRQPKG